MPFKASKEDKALALLHSETNQTGQQKDINGKSNLDMVQMLKNAEEPASIPNRENDAMQGFKLKGSPLPLLEEAKQENVTGVPRCCRSASPASSVTWRLSQDEGQGSRSSYFLGKMFCKKCFSI